MVSFENFVKSMPPSLSELKVTPSFCFPFKIPDDPTASIEYLVCKKVFEYTYLLLMIYSWQRMSVHTPHLCTQITEPVKIVAPYQVD